MICRLNEEQIKNLFAAVHGSIIASKNSGSIYNPEQFIKDLYNTLTQKGKLEQSGAIDYIQHVPQMIIQSFANFDDSKQQIRKNKISLDNLSQLDEDFNSDVNNILNFLGLSVTPSSVIEEIKDKSNPSENVISTETYTEIESKDKQIKSSSSKFVARPESALAVTNQEAKDYNGVEAKDNVVDTDPTKVTYFSVVRKLNSMLNDLNQDTADNLQLSPDIKGVFLRLVPGELIPSNNIQESDRQYGLNNRFVFAYTDSKGEFIYFDSKGNITTKELGGKIAYGSMRTIENDNVSSVQSIEELAKARNISVESAQKIRRSEIEIMKKSKEFVKNNPETVLLFSIKPGKNGYVNEDYDVKNKISSYNIKNGFKPWVAREDQENIIRGGVYFNVEGYDLPVLISRPKFNEIPNGFTEAIANEIFGNKLNNFKKIQFLKQFVHKDDTAIFEQNDKVYVKQNGKLIDTTDQNQKQTFIDNLNNQVLNINKDLIGGNVQYPDSSGLIVSKSYNNFLAENFYSHLQKNADNEIVSLNAYNVAELSGDALNKVFNVQKEEKPVIKESSLEQETPSDNPAEIFRKLLNNTDFKLKRSKLLGKTISTEEELEAAKQWYEKGELAKYVPFNVMMNVVNSDAFADFTVAGITLYEGSDFTDLYHEGWHVFSQMFLTKEEKKKLYGEGRKIAGSFTSFKGDTIKFSEASDLDLEEFFAEDFRNYALSKGKTIIDGRPVRNTIFRRIYNFLKLLFNGYSVKDIIADYKAVKQVSELYNNLYIGNINKYAPSIENVQFGLLRKGVESIDKKSNEELSYQDSLILMDTIDSLMASTLSEFNRNISSIFTKPELIGPLYQKIQYDLSEIRKKLLQEASETTQTKLADPSKFTNHSGGARGADTVWDILGRAFGVKNHKHYREPGTKGVDSYELQKRGVKSEEISVEDYEEGKEKATIAAEQLNRRISKDYAHYQYRNWAQVKYADAIFAVGIIENIVDKNTKKKKPVVKGGTGYAVQMAINEKKPVYVFDERTGKWYKMGLSKTTGEQIAVPTETPVLTENYAGIGSRNDITQVGKDAIREVYNKTFGKIEQTISKNNAIKIIDFALENWGDFSKVAKGEETRGIIAYHKKKSSYLTFEDKLEEMSPDEKDETLNKEEEEKEEGSELAKTEEQLKEEFGSNTFERKGNENSVYEIASKETIYLIKSLQELEKDGKTTIKNILGVAKLVNFDRTWGHVINCVQGSKDITTMYKRLMQDSNTFPELKQLAERLGDPALLYVNNDFASINQWLNFYKDFSVYKIPIKEVRVVKKGNNYNVEFTESNPQFRQAEQNFVNKFQSLQTKNKYIRRTEQGNILNVKEILSDFSIGSLDNPSVAFEFLNAVGFYLTDNKLVRSKIADKKLIVTYIYKGLENINENLKKNDKLIITNPLASLRDSKLGNSSGRVSEILEIEAKYSGKYSNNSIKNVKGDNEYDLSLNNSITKLLTELNASTNYNVFNLPHIKHLNYRNNPSAKYSIWMNSMFDFITGSRKQESTEENSNDVSLNIINLNGVKSIIESEEGSQFDQGGIKTTDVDISTKFLMDLHTMLLEGSIELPRHASKSTAYGVGVSKIYTDYNEGSRHLYINSGLFADKTLGLEAAVALIMPKLAAELERIAIIKSNQINNIPGFSQRGLDLVMFDDIIGDQELRKELINSANENDSLSVIKQEKFRDRVSSEIKKYLNELYKENMKIYEEMPFMSNSLLFRTGKNINKNIKDLAKIATGQDINDPKRLSEIAITSFTVNALIHNMETISVLYGDLSAYNHTKEDFHKRNAAIGSTGRSFCTDENIYKFLNQLGSAYSKKINAEQVGFDGQINSVIFKDSKVSSEYLQEYMDIFKEKFGEKAAEKILTPYSEMTEGDAQGWLTFDAYRMFCILESNWSPEQNDLYHKIIEGEEVSSEDIAEFFPPKKYQYAGPLKTDKLHVQGFHKFSLVPLIPSVIKGTNMETLHNNMVRQNIHYGVFESGSKLGIITRDGKPDDFYENNDLKTRNIKEWKEGDIEYTKNVVFLEYLKSQVDINKNWKEKTIFSTQLRKLIINDMFEQGQPLSEDMKKMVENFESNLYLLQKAKKEQLLKEAGWEENKKGELSGSMRSLMEFVERELTRLDLPEHDIDFVRNGLKTGKFDDLSFSLNSEKIEKLLNSVIVKRLIRQKLKGEQLIQVSGSGFETQQAYRNPTYKELVDYGTNGLPTYRPGKGKNGKTSAMKVKVSMKGDYYKLLNLTHNDGEKIGTRERLNEMIQNEEWIDKNDNRKMITMVAVRIPVQGFNSMEFMEVYEFLPEEAGNVIIPPSEIVAKSGSDFDIDKLTIFEPNYSYKIGEDNIISESMIDLVKKQFPKETNISKEYLDNIIKKLESEYPEDATKEERKIYKFVLKNIDSVPEYSKGKDTKSIENKVIENIREILEHPDNFISLVRPNETDIVKGVANDLSKENIQGYNHLANKNRNYTGKISPTRVLEPRYNLYKHESNNIGKKTLGIGAVDNTYSAIFKRIGLRLRDNYSYTTAKGETHLRDIRILLEHNTFDFADKKFVSFSNIFTKTGDKVSDIIGQLMNGWVDIEKDAWIFNINGNNIAGPVLLFLVEAGVDFRTAAYFVSQPLVVEYIKYMTQAKSPFFEASGKGVNYTKFKRFSLRKDFIDKNIETLPLMVRKNGDVVGKKFSNVDFDKLVNEYTDGITAFDPDFLFKNIQSKDKESREAKAAFLHFMEIENLMSKLTNIKLKVNVDTSPSKSLFAAQKRIIDIEELAEEDVVPNNTITNIFSRSPIKSFFIQDFQLKILKNLMKVRSQNSINNFLRNLIKDKNLGEESLPDAFATDEEKFVAQFHNDIPLYLLQNELKNIDIDNLKVYKGSSVKKAIPVKNVNLSIGAFVKDDVMYIDVDQLRRDFNTKAFAGEKYQQQGLSKVNSLMFTMGRNKEINFKEYAHFVIEREHLRSVTPISENQTKEEYEEMLMRRSLENTYNFYYMLKYPEYSTADEFMRIKNNYPQLSNMYLLLDDAIGYVNDSMKNDKEGNLTVNNNSKSFRTLKFTSSRLTKDTINVLHENLIRLSDPKTVKVVDPEENLKISNFFKRFIVAEYLRAGVSKSADNLSRILPPSTLMRLLEKPMRQINNKGLSPGQIQDYYNDFKVNWNNGHKKSRNKFRNYLIGESVKTSKKQLLIDLYLSVDKNDIISYPVEDLTIDRIKLFTELHADHIFVFPDVLHEKIINDQIKTFRSAENSVGIPVADSASKSWKDTTFEENKKAIDQRIDILENHMTNGKYLIFPNKGLTAIGNKETLKTNAPQTFYYLVEQMYSRLGYKIEGLIDDAQYKAILQAGQEITDAQVEEAIQKGYVIEKPLDIVEREDINQVFKNFPELVSIGTQEQFARYIKTIFPNSKIQDILYHGGTATPFNKNEMTNIDTETGIYLAKNLEEAKDYALKHGHLYSVVINMTNPISLDDARKYGGVTSISVTNEAEKKLINDNYDGINQLTGTESVYAIVFKPEQIHIIDKNDVAKFREFVKNDKDPFSC